MQKFIFSVLFVSFGFATPAFAQETDVPAEPEDVEVRSPSQSCEEVLERESECSDGALARIRRACSGQITTVSEANAALFRQFSQLWEQCTGETRVFGTTEEIDAALGTCRSTGSRALDCDEETTTSTPTRRPARTRQRYVCVDSAFPVDLDGNRVEEGRPFARCGCPDGLREVDVNYRTVRQELGLPNGVTVVTCSNPNPTAERIERTEIVRELGDCDFERDGGTVIGTSPDSPMVCREIVAIWSELTELRTDVDRATAGVTRHDETEADRCGVSVEAWVAMTREERRERCGQSHGDGDDVELGHFRLVLGARIPVRFETGVVSAYGIFGAEWAPRFTESVGLYARGYLGYGSYGDVPGQTGSVPLGESGIWGIAAGLELEPLPNLTLDIGVAFDSSLIEGQRGNAFGTYRWHNLGPELRIRYNLHEHFFIEGNVGAAWSRTVVDSNSVLMDVDGFGLALGVGAGFSF